MGFRLRPLLAAGLMLGAAAVGAADPGSRPAPVVLSLAEAIRLGQQYSALDRAAASRVRGAEARLRGARAAESPVLTLARNLGSSGVATDEGVLLTQTIEVGSKRTAAVRGARFERGAVAAEAEQTALEVTRLVKEAYYEALLADAQRRLAVEAQHTAEAFAQAAQVQFEAGDVAHNQVVRSQIDVAKAQQETATAQQEQADRYSELRSLLGIPAEADLDLTDSLQVTPVTYAQSDLTELALRQRPDLRAARLAVAVREAEVQGARAQRQPDLLWELRHDSFGPGGDTGVRAGISLPLLDLGRERAKVREAEAALAEQQATRDESERTARLEVEVAQHALEVARQQLASFEGGRVARAKELLSMAQVGYQQGASSYLEVVDAEQAYRTEEEAYAQAQAGYHLALAALEQAVGGKLP